VGAEMLGLSFRDLCIRLYFLVVYFGRNQAMIEGWAIAKSVDAES
jgi:hypothetical protein